MVVLVAPTPSTEYVRIALLVNGVAMMLWAPVVLYGKEMIRRAEGPRAVEKKTPFDLMILRICGLWVFFAGSAWPRVRERAQGGGAARLISRRDPLYGDLPKTPGVGWPWLLRRGRLGQCYPRLPLARRNCVGFSLDA